MHERPSINKLFTELEVKSEQFSSGKLQFDIDWSIKTFFGGHLLKLTNETLPMCKMPQISHHIWITSPTNPKIMRDYDTDIAKKSIALMDNDETGQWQHYLWTNCRPCLKDLGKTVTIRDISELKEQAESYPMIVDLLINNNKGPAIDTLKYELGKLFGGIVLDLNYVILNSPSLLMSQVNYFSEQNPENYMFATAPNHPIMNCVIENSLKMYEFDKEHYSQAESWMVLGHCYQLKANKDKNIDTYIKTNEFKSHSDEENIPDPIDLESYIKNMDEMLPHQIYKNHWYFCFENDFSIGFDDKGYQGSWADSSTILPLSGNYSIYHIEVEAQN